MSFELVYTRRAVKDVESLDPLAKKRIAQKIVELQENPLGKSKKLIDSRLGTYRYRIGDYRVIFDIHRNQVVILRIGHRREIYR